MIDSGQSQRSSDTVVSCFLRAFSGTFTSFFCIVKYFTVVRTVVLYDTGPTTSEEHTTELTGQLTKFFQFYGSSNSGSWREVIRLVQLQRDLTCVRILQYIFICTVRSYR